MPAQGTFDTSIRAWLQAMNTAQRIKPGGKLLFINKRTGATVAVKEQPPSAPPQNAGPTVRTDGVTELRRQGMVLGKKKSGNRTRR